MKIIGALLLFALVQQNDASKKREKGNRTLTVLKKGVRLLVLLYGSSTNASTNKCPESISGGCTNSNSNAIANSHLHFTARSFVHPKTQNCEMVEPVVEDSGMCPTVPQRNAVELMNYVRCYRQEEPEFDQYLMNIGDCENIKSLYEKALELGQCVMNAPNVILQGVKSYLTGQPESGQTFSTISYEMLAAHLETLEQNFEIDAKGAQRLIKKARKIDDLDFFQVKRAAEFLQTNSNHTPEEAFGEALESKYQNYDFDKVEKMLTYTKIWFPDADHVSAAEAMKVASQNYDFDKVEQMMKIAKRMYPNSEYDASREAFQRSYLDLDLMDTELVLKTVLTRKFEYQDSDRVDELLKILTRIFKTEKRVYGEIFANWNKLKELSLEEISAAVETSLLSRDPETILWEQLQSTDEKEVKKREDL